MSIYRYITCIDYIIDSYDKYNVYKIKVGNINVNELVHVRISYLTAFFPYLNGSLTIPVNMDADSACLCIFQKRER